MRFVEAMKPVRAGRPKVAHEIVRVVWGLVAQEEALSGSEGSKKSLGVTAPSVTRTISVRTFRSGNRLPARYR